MPSRCLNCDKRASFNIKGKSAEYCAEHKTNKMINVVNKICKTDDCDKRARYNIISIDVKYSE